MGHKKNLDNIGDTKNLDNIGDTPFTSVKWMSLHRLKKKPFNCSMALRVDLLGGSQQRSINMERKG
jgi:hypothetical protein